MISTDGRTWASSTCLSFHCERNYGDRQIESCNKIAHRRNGECKVLASGSDVVWEGKVNYPEMKAGEVAFYISVSNPDAPETQTYSGVAKIQEGSPDISLNMGYRGNVCDGSADRSTWKWSLRCANSETFSGTFVDGAKNLYEGIGTMISGKSVDFSIQRQPDFRKSG